MCANYVSPKYKKRGNTHAECAPNQKKKKKKVHWETGKNCHLYWLVHNPSAPWFRLVTAIYYKAANGTIGRCFAEPIYISLEITGTAIVGEVSTLTLGDTESPTLFTCTWLVVEVGAIEITIVIPTNLAIVTLPPIASEHCRYKNGRNEEENN